MAGKCVRRLIALYLLWPIIGVLNWIAEKWRDGLLLWPADKRTVREKGDNPR